MALKITLFLVIVVTVAHTFSWSIRNYDRSNQQLNNIDDYYKSNSLRKNVITNSLKHIKNLFRKHHHKLPPRSNVYDAVMGASQADVKQFYGDSDYQSSLTGNANRGIGYTSSRSMDYNTRSNNGRNPFKKRALTTNGLFNYKAASKFNHRNDNINRKMFQQLQNDENLLLHEAGRNVDYNDIEMLPV